MMILKRRLISFGFTLFQAAVVAGVAQSPATSARWWSRAVEDRLAAAGTNRTEISQALAEVADARREGMAFLMENMPEADLRSLTAAFLLENLNLAYDEWEKSPWRARVTQEMFFNDVLPYACMNEARDPWRAKLRAVCSPMVASCKTPGEAAHLLNQKIFPHFNVRYNTSRRRPDQSPGESIQSGIATCTGLSILLADACRSVGIPARVAGTPMWSNLRGNHTWVEIWDGEWHFAGAAEPDAAGLDHGWFVHDATTAKRDVPEHAIYATSFRRTGISFPLVWLPGDKSVSAVNVTDRYTAKAAPKAAKEKTASGPSVADRAIPPIVKPLPAKDAASLTKELDKYFAATADQEAHWKFSKRNERWLGKNEVAVRQLAWEAYRSAPIHAKLKADFDAQVARFQQYLSPYTMKTVGTRPAKGWALFIAMHGGGGAPKEVNDSQWKRMQIYYKDHPEAGGYLYLALRAPNDTWNGFYDDYVYPLIDNLVRQFRLFGDIDPDKVFIMGYSHGGYGAYAIGPKMPDRFAAIHASAAAATDGESTPKTLRTTPFTAMVGELDTMYGRYERNQKFKAEIEELRGGRTDIYPVAVTIVAGNGHRGLPDRDKIKDLYPSVRNPVPREVTWLMTDGVVRDFFWLRVPQPAKRQEILASCRENRFVITANESVAGATVFMDSRMVDFNKPVDIELNGSTSTRRFTPSLKTFCETLARRGDPAFAFSAGFTIIKDSGTGRLVIAKSDK